MGVKLIDILVQDLPGLGGWPKDRTVASHGPNNCVMFHELGVTPFVYAGLKFEGNDIVTKEEYEAALAASKPEWDGEGIPPVGTVCEYTKQSLTVKEWTECTIDYVGSSFIVYRDCYGVELTGIKGDIKFRPVRSEADKKKEEAVFAIAELCRGSASNGHSAELIYDAIKSGKIVID